MGGVWVIKVLLLILAPFFIWFTQLDLLTMYVYLLKLAKMYAKYQEAIDALRHEQLGRKESEAVLQRVWLTWCLFFMYNLKRLIWKIISLMFCLVYLVLICKMENKKNYQGMGGCNYMDYYPLYHLYASMQQDPFCLPKRSNLMKRICMKWPFDVFIHGGSN